MNPFDDLGVFYNNWLCLRHIYDLNLCSGFSYYWQVWPS